MTAPFIIIASRGRLRMFSVDQAPGRLRLTSIADSLMVDPRLKTSEKYADQAGRRDNPGDSMTFGSTDEQLKVGIEEDKRLFKYIGQSITSLLQEHGVQRWSFAAPSEVNEAILRNVDDRLRAGLADNVKKDLINVEVANLASHFNISLGPVPAR